MRQTEEAVAALETRLARFPPDRYPVQHATTSFHLGTLLAEQGRLDEAEEALCVAVERFPVGSMPLEHGKALNALGAVLRSAQRHAEAAEVLQRASDVFSAADAALEHAIAAFNLGLVHLDTGSLPAAVDALRRACDRFTEADAGRHLAAARRELGAALLRTGALDEAERHLAAALTAAERLQDATGWGAAANALGLVRLARGEAREAIELFHQAAAAHPRGIRPGEHAMAKANLAQAYAESGDVPRARLAARQALAAPIVPDAVRAQAQEVLERFGDELGDVLRVLDAEPPERWEGVLRDEVVRWVDLPGEQRRAEVDAWVRQQVARADEGAALATVLLGRLLELPPAALRSIAGELVAAAGVLPLHDRERLHRQLDSGMVRFEPPQWLRLRDTFDGIAAELEMPWPDGPPQARG